MRFGRLQVATLFIAALGGCGAASSRGPVATSAQPFTLTPLATFESPWAMAFLPNGDALVTEKAGHLRHYRAGKITDVPGVPKVAEVDQGGLLDVKLSPGFAADRLVYLTYTAAMTAGGAGLVLARGRLDGTDPGATRLADVRILWRDPQGGKGGQFGAIVTFAPDGQSLFLTSGERQRFTPAQDGSQPLGKILHLTLDGAPAPGTPAATPLGSATTSLTDPPSNTVAARSATRRAFRWTTPNRTPAETWTTGHRNPYGLAFDAAGNLWETEMGPKGGDELNLILPGKNYGWPQASNGSNYDGIDIPDHRPGDGFEAPKLFWNPSISPGGLMIYRGAKWPAWRGDAFIPALSAEALIRVHLQGTTATKADQWPLAHRIRHVAQSPTGDIYLLEDEGRLLRLDPAK